MVSTKACLGWAMHDLTCAAELLVNKPPGYWDREDRRATKDYLVHTIKEAHGFLKAVGHLQNPARDHAGNTFWFDDEGNVVRWEKATPRRGRRG